MFHLILLDCSFKVVKPAANFIPHNVNSLLPHSFALCNNINGSATTYPIGFSPDQALKYTPLVK